MQGKANLSDHSISNHPAYVAPHQVRSPHKLFKDKPPLLLLTEKAHNLPNKKGGRSRYRSIKRNTRRSRRKTRKRDRSSKRNVNKSKRKRRRSRKR